MYFPEERVDENTELSDGECLLGAIIQGCCLIEAAGHYSHNKTGVEDAFVGFVTDYMKQYNGQELYWILRCGLVHNYVPTNNKGKTARKYALIKNAANKHLQPVPDKADHFFINVQSFIQHVDQGITQFLKDASESKNSRDVHLVARAKAGDSMSAQAFSFSELDGRGMIIFCDTASGPTPIGSMAGAADILITTKSDLKRENTTFNGKTFPYDKVPKSRGKREPIY